MAVYHVVWIDEHAIRSSSDPAALGAALRKALTDPRPDRHAPPPGTGFLSHEGFPLELRTGEVTLLHWSRGSLTRWIEHEGPANIEAWLDLGGEADPDARPVSALVIDAEHGIGSPEDLGSALLELASDPRQQVFRTGNTEIRRSARVAWDDEQILVFDRWSSVKPGKRLTPAERAAVVAELARDHFSRPEPRVADAVPVLFGFDLLGVDFDDHIALGPGQLVALFGRNGAGKTLILDAVATAARNPDREARAGTPTLDHSDPVVVETGRTATQPRHTRHRDPSSSPVSATRGVASRHQRIRCDYQRTGRRDRRVKHPDRPARDRARIVF